MWPARGRMTKLSASPLLREHAVALQVDDLLGLGDGEVHRSLAARMGVGAHEAMLLHALGCVLVDDAGGLVLAIGAIGRRADAIALVFDGRGRRGIDIGAGAPGPEAVPGGLEVLEHRLRPGFRHGGDYITAAGWLRMEG